MKREKCAYFGKFPPGVHGPRAVSTSIPCICTATMKLCIYHRGESIDACEYKKQQDKERRC